MKRFFDNRSKSAETLAMVSISPSFGAAVEPQSKKQRQSVIKQSVKRLFGSVKRLLPTSHRRRDKIGLEETTHARFSPAGTVMKSVAVQEAEAFLARLGPDWTTTQVNDRIEYLYRLINDAFERTYHQAVKDMSIIGPNQNAIDYMAEVRRLQAMVAERQDCESKEQRQTSINQCILPRGSLSYSADIIGVDPTRRASSVDVCQQQPALQPAFGFAPINLGSTRPFSPGVPLASITQMAVNTRPEDFSEGMICNGFLNNVSLPFYTLSQSHASFPPLKLSESNIEVQASVKDLQSIVYPEVQAVAETQIEPAFKELQVEIAYKEPQEFLTLCDDELMDETENFEEKIQLFEWLSKSRICSLGSFDHDKMNSYMSLPNLCIPRSLEPSRDELPYAHAHNQSFGSVPMESNIMQLLNQHCPAPHGHSEDFCIIDQKDCSRRRCSVRELARMFENTTI